MLHHQSVISLSKHHKGLEPSTGSWCVSCQLSLCTSRVKSSTDFTCILLYVLDERMADLCTVADKLKQWLWLLGRSENCMTLSGFLHRLGDKTTKAATTANASSSTQIFKSYQVFCIHLSLFSTFTKAPALINTFNVHAQWGTDHDSGDWHHVPA